MAVRNVLHQAIKPITIIVAPTIINIAPTTIAGT